VSPRCGASEDHIYGLPCDLKECLTSGRDKPPAVLLAMPFKRFQRGGDSKGPCDGNTLSVEDVQIYLAIFVLVVLLSGGAYLWFKGRKIVTELTTQVFNMVDADHNGTIDKHELYSAVLMFYLKLNTKVRIKPPTHEVLEKLGLYEKCPMDKEAFLEAMMTLASQAIGRLLSYALATTTAPFMAPYIVQAEIFALEYVNLDYASLFSDCQKVAIETALPNFNRQLATTLTSVSIVTILLPRFFDWIDSGVNSADVLIQHTRQTRVSRVKAKNAILKKRAEAQAKEEEAARQAALKEASASPTSGWPKWSPGKSPKRKSQNEEANYTYDPNSPQGSPQRRSIFSKVSKRLSSSPSPGRKED
jgi:hypothetical protein